MSKITLDPPNLLQKNTVFWLIFEKNTSVAVTDLSIKMFFLQLRGVKRGFRHIV